MGNTDDEHSFHPLGDSTEEERSTSSEEGGIEDAGVEEDLESIEAVPDSGTNQLPSSFSPRRSPRHHSNNTSTTSPVATATAAASTNPTAASNEVPTPRRSPRRCNTPTTNNKSRKRVARHSQGTTAKSTRSQKRKAVPKESRISGGLTKRMKKSAKQKSFRLASDKRKPDPLVHKRVAFDINDNGYGQELLNHFGGIEKVSSSLSNGTYLFGTILGLSKEKRGGVSYDVAWEDLQLGKTPIALLCIILE